jgi:KaiC/GvpD/RAD55 family RecA-like ATPase
MPDEVTVGLGKFFDYYWHTQEAFVYVATLDKGTNFKQYVLPWPSQRAGIIRHVLAENAAGHDVYFSPAMYRPKPDGSRPKPTKENVLGTHVLWADFDGEAPDNWEVAAKEKNIPEPTQIVQSSVKGREHVYWQLDKFTTDIESVENRNRSIAFALGADASGWDADQLLRPAFTVNYGYRNSKTGEPAVRKSWFTGEPIQVATSSTSDRSISIDHFASLGSPEREVLDRLNIGELPTVQALLAFGNWDADFLRRFNMTQEEARESSPEKRSGAIMALGYTAAEHGFSDEQMYAMIQDVDTRWEKYADRSNAGKRKQFLDIIARARAKIGYLTGNDLTFAGLLGTAKPIVDNPQLVYGFTDFLNTDVHIDWLIEGLLAEGSIGIVTGQPGVGKTQFGIQLAITLASEIEQFLIWKNVSGSPKKVLFLSLEMGHAFLKSFMDKIAERYSDHLSLQRNLQIAPLGTGIRLDRPEGQAFLNNLLSEYKPDVLLIDSLQKMTTSVLTDEIATKALMDYMVTVREQYNCTALVVHHNRKKGNDGQSAGGLSDMYGHQFLAADADLVVNLRKTGHHDIAVDAWKNKLAEEWDTFNILRDKHLQFNLYDGSVSNGLNVDLTRFGDITRGPDNSGEDRAQLSL